MADPYSVIEHYLKLALDRADANFDPFEINDALDEIKARELRQQERLQKLEAQLNTLTSQVDQLASLVIKHIESQHARISSLEERVN